MAKSISGGSVIVRLYAVGKIVLTTEGDPLYAADAADACDTCATIEPVIDKERFRKRLRERGVPLDVIEEFVGNLDLNDDSTFFRDKPY
jgi:hypothetical protein